MKQKEKRCLILQAYLILIFSIFIFSSRTQAQPKGLKLEFSAEGILPTLKPEIAKRIFK